MHLITEWMWAIRIRSGQPSIDCILLRKRLLYLPRMWHSPFLRSVSAVGAPGQLLPWARQILDDLECIRWSVPELASMGPPSVEHKDWCAMILSDSWPQLAGHMCGWCTYREANTMQSNRMQIMPC